MRRIHCLECAAMWKFSALDAADGWKNRSVPIICKKPTVHEIHISGNALPSEVIRLDVMKCDGCNKDLPDGAKAVAISMWRGGELGPWEKEFSQP